MSEAIGNRIRDARESAGLTQFELGAAIGVRESQVSCWERGVNEPRGSTIVDIAKVLKVRAGWLLDNEGERQADEPVTAEA
jgi:transcriptional regulator with XRE-family HTH domain